MERDRFSLTNRGKDVGKRALEPVDQLGRAYNNSTRIFQAIKQTTTQLTTTSYADIITWDTLDPDNIIDSSHFSFNYTTGVLTILKKGIYEINLSTVCITAAFSRSDVLTRMQVNKSGAGYSVPNTAEYNTYGPRNAINSNNSTNLGPFYLSLLPNDLIKFQIATVGIQVYARARINIRRIR